MRVKSSTVTRKKRRTLRKRTKGMIKSRRASVRHGKEAVTKAETHATRHRRTRKREFRALWITRLNAAVRAEGVSYSVFIKELGASGVELDRKVLAEMAIKEPESFKKLVDSLHTPSSRA